MDPQVCWKKYPRQYEETIITRQNEEVFLRPIKPSDGPLIEELFARLSPPSIYFRFLTHMHHLRPELLHHLVHLDYENEFALAAVVEEKHHDVIIGVCRYVSSFEPTQAELAVVVRDDWQGRGVGKELVTRVFKIAKKHGIAMLELRIDPRNESSVRLFKNMGYSYSYEESMWDVSDRMMIYL